MVACLALLVVLRNLFGLAATPRQASRKGVSVESQVNRLDPSRSLPSGGGMR